MLFRSGVAGWIAQGESDDGAGDLGEFSRAVLCAVLCRARDRRLCGRGGGCATARLAQPGGNGGGVLAIFSSRATLEGQLKTRGDEGHYGSQATSSFGIGQSSGVGGGGSSYATDTATGVNHTQGYANATTSGYALISYQVSAAAPTTTATEVVYPIYTLANYEDSSAFSTQPTCTTAYLNQKTHV